MKNAAIFKIIMYSITAVLLCGVLVFGIVTDNTNIFDIFDGSLYKSEENDKGFTPSDNNAAVFPETIEKIEVEWISGDIIITTGDTKNIEAKETSDYSITDSNRMTYSTSGNTVKIRFGKTARGSIGVNNIKPKTLTLTLPEKLYHEIDIDTVSADVTMTDFKAEKIDVETVSGNAELTNIQVDEIEFSSVSGDVNMDGDINKSGDFSNVSGNAVIILPLNAEWRADFDTMSGKFRTDFAVNMTAKSTYMVGAGNIALSFDTVSGDAEIKGTSP